MPDPQRRWPRQLLTGLGAIGAMGVLVLVFLSYLQPALVVELGNRLWSCF